LENASALASYILTDFWNNPKEEVDYLLLLHSEVLDNLLTNFIIGDEVITNVMSYQFFKEILHNIQKYKNQGEYKKLMLFSGHDDNLIAILRTLWKKNNTQCIMEKYQSILLKSEIKSRVDYESVKEEMERGDCFMTIPFASNLIFEVFQGTG
jgi:hypothetical protein